MKAVVFGAAALGVAALVAACSGGGGDPSSSSGANESGCFLAFNGQFDGFRSWQSYSYEGTDEGDGGIHIAGPRTEYINHAPPHGSSAFPVGTLIVKEVGASDPKNHHIFAMAKRGCGFNAAGAKDWEWFELTESPPGATVLWRGVGPPAGETYGGDPTGCNTCHAACTDNDSVCSSRVRLAGF
jgi:hypothetical protein